MLVGEGGGGGGGDNSIQTINMCTSFLLEHEQNNIQKNTSRCINLHSLDRFPQYSRASIYRHAKKAIGGDTIFDKRKHNKGRPRKISERDKRNLIRQIAVLRRVEGSSFTAKCLCVAAGCATIFRT